MKEGLTLTTTNYLFGCDVISGFHEQDALVDSQQVDHGVRVGGHVHLQVGVGLAFVGAEFQTHLHTANSTKHASSQVTSQKHALSC